MLRGMKAARTAPVASKSAQPGARARKLAVVAPPVPTVLDDDQDDEPMLPGDEVLLAMTDAELEARHYFTHEEVIAMLAELRAKSQPGGSS